MAALDTNILVRLLVADDAEQFTAAERLMREHAGAGRRLFVPITVALELEWVLRSRFRFGKSAVMQAMSQLLSSFELSFESEGALEAALQSYGQGGADFSDCVHAALAFAAGEDPLWTFDKAAAKLDKVRLLTA